MPSILLVLATTACSDKIQFRVPPLNEADRARLTCSAFPDFEGMLGQLPAHEFLSGTDGTPVVTPDGRKWVAFDVVNEREGRMLKFGGVDARGVHFECFDDLNWLGSVWTDLEG